MAIASKHLQFEAVDLIAVSRPEAEQLFRELCAIHAALGPQSRFGLGAYFNPENAGNSGGRFHVDASGFRSWGYSYKAGSSGCLAFE